MNKNLQIAFGIIIVGLFAVSVIQGMKISQTDTLGSLFVSENSYSSAPTYSTSSVVITAGSLLARATSSRTFAKICNQSANTVYLYKQATSTGVVTNMGYPIYATSSNGLSCATYDANDPYLGQIWGIAAATSTVSIESIQN